MQESQLFIYFFDSDNIMYSLTTYPLNTTFHLYIIFPATCDENSVELIITTVSYSSPWNLVKTKPRNKSSPKYLLNYAFPIE